MSLKKYLALGMILVMAFGTMTVSASDKQIKDEPVAQELETTEEVADEVYDSEYDDYDDEDYDDFDLIEMAIFDVDIEDMREYVTDEAKAEEFFAAVTRIRELEEELWSQYDVAYDASDAIDWDAALEDYEMDYDDEDEFELTVEMVPEIVADIIEHDFKDDLSEEVLTQATTLLETALMLEAEGKFEEAEQAWIQLEEMDVFNWEDDFQDYDDEDFDDADYDDEDLYDEDFEDEDQDEE